MTYKYVIKRNADSVKVLRVHEAFYVEVASVEDDKRLADLAERFFRVLARVGGVKVVREDV